MNQSLGGKETLRWWERSTVVALLVAVVGFGFVVELRSALQQRRKGDFGVFVRAGWAVRQGGADLYNITCDNHWHYAYPPTLAVLLVPLADPPRGETAPFLVPYPVSVAIWYVLSILCLAWGLDVLASALDPEAVRGSRRWWALRSLPLLACLAPIGGTAGRGQVGLLLVALLCGWLASAIRGRRLQGGLFLAGAICLKIFPAFLVLVPLSRRDGRCLAGCVIGLFVGLLLIPAAVMGPSRTMWCYAEIWRSVVSPAVQQDDAATRSRELTNVTATDSQSFVALLHNTLNLDRATRPLTASPAVRYGHWALGAVMTLLTVLAFRGGPNRLTEGQLQVLYGGATVLCMMMLSPVCHLHYFCMLVPLAMGLVAATPGGAVYPRPWVLALLGLFAVTQVLPLLIPALEVLRDLCVASYGGLLLWSAGCLLAMWGRRAAQGRAAEPALFSRAA